MDTREKAKQLLEYIKADLDADSVGIEPEEVEAVDYLLALLGDGEPVALGYISNSDLSVIQGGTPYVPKVNIWAVKEGGDHAIYLHAAPVEQGEEVEALLDLRLTEMKHEILEMLSDLHAKPPILHERDENGDWICCCGDHLAPVEQAKPIGYVNTGTVLKLETGYPGKIHPRQDGTKVPVYAAPHRERGSEAVSLGKVEGNYPVLVEAFEIHHPKSLYCIVHYHGESWLLWKHPDGQWVTEQKIRTAILGIQEKGDET